MDIKTLKMTAVIPVQQYGNIQPSIEIDIKPGELELANKCALDYISDLFNKYSEKGGLTAKDIVVSKFTKKSFNEDVEIEFEPVAHTYTHKGKPLTGATDYIKKFYKPFDSKTISAVLEKNWGVPEQNIRQLWDENGNLTSEFGSIVHASLEHYEKFKDIGEVISSKKGEKGNYCLPKHPVLRSIIEGFIEINKGEVGRVVTEALVSDVESGVCGHADRIVILDEEKKICRVKDYKVNVNSEEVDKSQKVLAPFDMLPSTKLSKYQLQMSIYANLLQKSGWTVVGLDVYVYESEWKHFELPILKVI